MSSTDRFEATIIVGNTPNGDPAVAQAAPFQYIPDPGDGTGIAAAIAAAAANNGDMRIRIRPGVYLFSAGQLPLTIPRNTIVEGSGIATSLSAADVDERTVFTLDQSASLRDLEISLGSPTGQAPSGAFVVQLGERASALRVVANVGSGEADQEDDSLTGVFGFFGSGAWAQDCDAWIVDPPTTGTPTLAAYQVGPRQSGPTVTDARILDCTSNIDSQGDLLWVAGSASRLTARVSGGGVRGAQVSGSDHTIELDATLETDLGFTPPYAYVIAASNSRFDLSVRDGNASMDGYVSSGGASRANIFELHAYGTTSAAGVSEAGSDNAWTGVCGGGAVVVTGDRNTFTNFRTSAIGVAPQALTVSGDDNVFVTCRFGSETDTGTGNESSHNLTM